jgi:hypothetical protein
MGCTSSTSAKAHGPAPKAEEPQASNILEPPQEEPQKAAPTEEPKTQEPPAKEAEEEAVEPDPEAEKLFAKYGEQSLKITIVSAKDLRNADFVPGSGKSDPYCVCEVKRKPQLKFQTPVIDDMLNPTWDHQDRFEKFSAGDSLVFTVFDKDVVGSDLLGDATLERGTFEHGFEGDLPLDGKGKGPSASLRVRVEALVAIEQEAIEVPILEPASEGAAPAPKGFFCCG